MYVPDKWGLRFLQLAEHISKWSKDPSTKIGTVIVNDLKLVIGMGFNGFPRGVYDRAERYAVREEKYKRVVHGEVNAILNSVDPKGLRGATMYQWPIPPCNECAKLIIQVGIKTIISGNKDIDRWRDSIQTTNEMFEEAMVRMWLVDWELVFVEACPELPETRGGPAKLSVDRDFSS
jgi:dCMP deaminase